MDQDRHQLGGDVKRSDSVVANLRTMWPYVRRYRRGLALGMGALVLKDVFGAALPLVIRSGVDTFTSGLSFGIILKFAGLLILFSALKGVFQYWMRVIIIGISRDIEYDLRNDLFGNLVRLSSDFYGRFQTGDMMARATNDLNAVRMMLGPGIMYWTETVLTLIFAIAIMLTVDWRLTLMALAPAPVVSLVVVVSGVAFTSASSDPEDVLRHQQPRSGEPRGRTRHPRLRSGKSRDGEFEELNRAYIRAEHRLARLSGTFMPLLQTLIGITFLLVLWSAGGGSCGRITWAAS